MFSIFNLVINLFYSQSSTTDASSQILLPTTNPSIDKDSLENLRANNFQTIYYTEVYNQYKTDKLSTAIINYQFAVPSIVFDGQSHIFVLNLTNETVVFGFDKHQSYNQSLNWPKNGTAFIIKGQCLSSNANDVILLNGFIYDTNSLTVTANYSHTNISDISNDFNVTIGSNETTSTTNYSFNATTEMDRTDSTTNPKNTIITRDSTTSTSVTIHGSNPTTSRPSTLTTGTAESSSTISRSSDPTTGTGGSSSITIRDSTPTTNRPSDPTTGTSESSSTTNHPSNPTTGIDRADSTTSRPSIPTTGTDRTDSTTNHLSNPTIGAYTTDSATNDPISLSTGLDSTTSTTNDPINLTTGLDFTTSATNDSFDVTTGLDPSISTASDLINLTTGEDPSTSTTSDSFDVLTETNQIDYAPNYLSNVQYVDESFFPDANGNLNENSYLSLNESDDALLDVESGGDFNSLSQALLYDLLDARYYNEIDAYEEFESFVALEGETDNTITKRALSRRRRGLFSWVKKAVKAVGSVFKTVATVFTTAAKVVKEVATVIKTAILGGTYEKSEPVSFTIGPNSAFDIYSHEFETGITVKLTCEECQVQETLNIHAKFHFTKNGILTVMETGFIEVNGQILAKAILGLFVTVDIDKSRVIASFPITPLIVPGVVSLGPTITLEVGAFVTIEGELGATFGAYFTWDNVYIKIDVKNPLQSTFSGLLPDKIEPKFEFKTKLEMDLGVYLQPKFELALLVFNGVLRAAVGFATKFIAGAEIGYDKQSEKCPGGLSLAPYLKFELNVFAEIGVASIKELEKDGTIYEKQTSFPFLGEYCFGADITSISTTTTTTISKELVLKLNHLCRYWFRYIDKFNCTNLLRW